MLESSLQDLLIVLIFFPDYPDPDSFCWEKYLEETGTSAVPTWAFKVVSHSPYSSRLRWRSTQPDFTLVLDFTFGRLWFPGMALSFPLLGAQLYSSPTASPTQLPGQHEAGGCGLQEPSPDSSSQRGGCRGPSDKGGAGTLGPREWTGEWDRNSVERLKVKAER